MPQTQHEEGMENMLHKQSDGCFQNCNIKNDKLEKYNAENNINSDTEKTRNASNPSVCFYIEQSQQNYTNEKQHGYPGSDINSHNASCSEEELKSRIKRTRAGILYIICIISTVIVCLVMNAAINNLSKSLDTANVDVFHLNVTRLKEQHAENPKRLSIPFLDILSAAVNYNPITNAFKVTSQGIYEVFLTLTLGNDSAAESIPFLVCIKYVRNSREFCKRVSVTGTTSVDVIDIVKLKENEEFSATVNNLRLIYSNTYLNRVVIKQLRNVILKSSFET